MKDKQVLNCEISHIARTAATSEVYKQRQNAFFISECVEHTMFKVTWARLCVFERTHDRVHVFRHARGLAVRYARLGRVRGSVVRGARLGRDACAHGRIHGLVAHGLKFMDMIEPCG